MPQSRCTIAPEPDVNLGILVGLLLTDGSVSKNGSSWTIEFINKSEELHKLFRTQVSKIFGTHSIREINDHRSPEIKRSLLKSNSVARTLLQVIPTFRTKRNNDGSFPASCIPSFVFSLSKDEIAKVLQVIFSTDGCVSIWPTWNKRKKLWEVKKLIKISCKHPIIRGQIVTLLKKLGFEPTLREINDEIVLFKKRDIIKFDKEIRFVDGVKISKKSKNWKGFEKNQIVSLAIKTFNLKKKDLERFKTKEEVINFLKHLLR
jgi:hypothetical protein